MWLWIENLTGPPGAIPSGVIVMWSGALGSIPDGWHLCDGTAGTPDLRNRFVKGGDPGSTGGNAIHRHELPFHLGAPLRTLSPGIFGLGTSRPAARQVGTTANTTTAGVALSESVNNEPPFYTLAFIIKI